MMMVVMRLFYRNESDAEGDGFDTCHMGSQLNPSLNFITTIIIIVGTIIIPHYLYSRSKIGEIWWSAYKNTVAFWLIRISSMHAPIELARRGTVSPLPIIGISLMFNHICPILSLFLLNVPFLTGTFSLLTGGHSVRAWGRPGPTTVYGPHIPNTQPAPCVTRLYCRNLFMGQMEEREERVHQPPLTSK